MSVEEAAGRLEQLVEQMQAGERIVLTRDGKPFAELHARRERKGGLNRKAIEEWKRELGVDRLVTYIADDFDDPLPEDFLITPEG